MLLRQLFPILLAGFAFTVLAQDEQAGSFEQNVTGALGVSATGNVMSEAELREEMLKCQNHSVFLDLDNDGVWDTLSVIGTRDVSPAEWRLEGLGGKVYWMPMAEQAAMASAVAFLNSVYLSRETITDRTRTLIEEASTPTGPEGEVVGELNLTEIENFTDTLSSSTAGYLSYARVGDAAYISRGEPGGCAAVRLDFPLDQSAPVPEQPEIPNPTTEDPEDPEDPPASSGYPALPPGEY